MNFADLSVCDGAFVGMNESRMRKVIWVRYGVKSRSCFPNFNPFEDSTAPGNTENFGPKCTLYSTDMGELSLRVTMLGLLGKLVCS
ncbi:hypothetical protein AVEN_147875-1 [Araneus ventricosus]|uniref:Uncharacterized protein n=1 Tax=Araneus ventricosus TaxID=182803 RepID=A0A4Y2S1W9_ARAVE|nr:hypothetical protein AVEN_147875-1 [Araneus ventricosus]